MQFETKICQLIKKFGRTLGSLGSPSLSLFFLLNKLGDGETTNFFASPSLASLYML